MKPKYWLLGLGTLFSIGTFAQKPQLIDGRVRLYDGKVTPVTIKNKRSGELTKADNRGYFMVEAAIGDTIHFSDKKLASVNYIIGSEDLKASRFNVLMTKKGQALEEIVIVRKDFGDDFFEGVTNKGMTRAERKYKKNNTVFASTSNYGMGISIDALVNMISGQKKKDKQDIIYEKLDMKVQKFYEDYTREELLQDMKVPEDRIDAFLYYLVAQPSYDKIKVERTESFQLYLAQQYTDFVGFVGLDQ
ncbi:hypothetical protein HX017_07270 [Myroides marinus]|uniref:CarboxypepD_reg-like domain-containing protein n=1 Tax=Myroides marinus TaxID=703342 RepID=A0A1H6XF26_9FLAO|nr:hypothetical protein [Myroides marinus]KUF44247.1 hypothetical protein AS361_00495 [Myroides marinus]MDM1346561.1 hypothetical protein [Myroides marinus]MDM1349966.1 hypothetical protein [Myroides marinus]MDM1353473.1 hypothetical protein [Myroides marinus]MDM1357173.1 hypothetical protein [Myroides marinus]